MCAQMAAEETADRWTNSFACNELEMDGVISFCLIVALGEKIGIYDETLDTDRKRRTALA